MHLFGNHIFIETRVLEHIVQGTCQSWLQIPDLTAVSDWWVCTQECQWTPSWQTPPATRTPCSVLWPTSRGLSCSATAVLPSFKRNIGLLSPFPWFPFLINHLTSFECQLLSYWDPKRTSTSSVQNTIIFHRTYQYSAVFPQIPSQRLNITKGNSWSWSKEERWGVQNSSCRLNCSLQYLCLYSCKTRMEECA